MQTRQFPFIALGFGIVLGGVSVAGATMLPLLTRLIVAEFAFFVTAIGAFIAATISVTCSLGPAASVIFS